MANEDWDEAVRRIEELRESGEVSLSLLNLRISSLPAEISDLTDLEQLDLRGTQISDTSLTNILSMTGLRRLYLANTLVSDTGLIHVRALTGLECLDLANTSIADLRPLLTLSLLTKTPRYDDTQFLYLDGTPALKNSIIAAVMANKSDEYQRKALLAHLRSLPPWPEPLPGDIPSKPADSDALVAPEQDHSLKLIWGENGFDFLAATTERDPIVDAALEELQALLETLLRKGNAHDDLYARAQKALALLDTDPPDALKLHMQYQALMRLHAGAEARQDGFDAETLDALGSLPDVVPGITLTHPDVLKLIERQEADRKAARIGIDPARERAVLEKVADPDAPFSPEVKETAVAAADPNLNDRLTGTRSVLSRNALIASVAAIVVPAATGGVIGAETHALYRWLLANPTVLEALAASMGDSVYWWVRTNLAKIPDLMDRQEARD